MNPYLAALPGFDEDAYLAHNADVREAVERGHFRSTWDHFSGYGYRERRRGVDQAIVEEFLRLKQAIDATLPPAGLRKRVHGIEDASSFEAIGALTAADIARAVRGTGALAPRRIFDFGCGCGRVLKHLRTQFPEAAFVGSDIDTDAISWCAGKLQGTATFMVNADLPPLALANADFDLVCANSVFTHLPEDMQFAWLEELARVTTSGGLFVASIHGEFATSSIPLTAAQRLAWQSAGFLYLEIGATSGLPDYYRTACHQPEYVHRSWGRWFDIIDIIHRGLAGHQDIVIARRR